MNKKTVAYILIGGLILGIVYWLYTKSKASAAAKALGAGLPDNRGAWAAADDALYAKFRNMFTADEVNWLDPLVESVYTGGGGKPEDMIKGLPSKAGSFARVIYDVAPNGSGTYPPLPWGTTGAAGLPLPSLWPKSKIDTLFTEFNKLKKQYGGL